MRRLLAAFFCLFIWSSDAWSQCSGNFPAGSVCGNDSAGPRPGQITPLPTLLGRNCTTAGAFLVAIGSNNSQCSTVAGSTALIAGDVFINESTGSPSTPSQAPFQLRITASDTNHAHIALQSFGSDGALSAYAADGTANVPVATAIDRALFNINSKAWDGAAWGNAGVGNASVGLWAGETQAVGAHGSYITFETTPIGSTTRSQRVRVTPSGGLAVGLTTDTAAGVVNALVGFRGPLLIGGSGTTSTQLTFQTTTGNGTTDNFLFVGGNNGATTFGNLSATAFSATSYGITGTAGGGFIAFGAQSSNPTAPGATAFRLFADATGRFSWRRGSDTFVRTIDATLTADRVWTFPDVTDTVVTLAAAQDLTNKTISTLAGGTGAASTLTLESTTGAGTTDAILFKTGSQVLRASIVTGGQMVFGANGAATGVIPIIDINTSAAATAFVDTTIPQVRLLSANGAVATMAMQAYGAGGQFTAYGAGNTAASPAGFPSGSSLFSIKGVAFDGTVWGQGGAVAAQVGLFMKTAELQATGAHGTLITFETTPIGTTVRTVAMTVQNSGGISVGDSTDPTIGVIRALNGFIVGTAAKTLTLKQGANGSVGTFVCTSGGSITVNNTNVAITDTIIISLNTAGGTVSNAPALNAITAATSFVAKCATSDTSTYNYAIIKNAAWLLDPANDNRPMFMEMVG